MDSQFHRDRLQQKSNLLSLDDILDRGLMPVTPIKLEAAISNFIDSGPSKEIRKDLSAFLGFIQIMPTR